MSRAFSVTARAEGTNLPLVGARVCLNDRCALSPDSGRARLEGISEDWHAVQLTVSALGYQTVSQSVMIDPLPLTPPFVDVEWPDLYLPPAAPQRLRISGDRFLLGAQQWKWKGATAFDIPEQIRRGVDVRPRLRQMQDAGANIVRVLSMKKLKDDGGGWQLLPAESGPDLVRRTGDVLGELGLYGQYCHLADTARLLPETPRQQEYVARNREAMRAYPHLLEEIANERDHTTQRITIAAFTRPSGILSSVGSMIADRQPGPPWWDYASYSGRRAPAPWSPKPANNLNPMVFRDGDNLPLPCPMICNESVKPQDYGFHPGYAELMGKSAGVVAGGTFHSGAWETHRLWTPQEFACAVQFYEGIT